MRRDPGRLLTSLDVPLREIEPSRTLRIATYDVGGGERVLLALLGCDGCGIGVVCSFGRERLPAVQRALARLERAG